MVNSKYNFNGINAPQMLPFFDGQHNFVIKKKIIEHLYYECCFPQHVYPGFLKKTCILLILALYLMHLIGKGYQKASVF